MGEVADRGRGAPGAAGGVRVLCVGGLATVTMDAAMLGAGIVGGRAWAPERLELGIIGRWAGGLLRGRIRHDEITTETPVRGELWLGLLTHYATGAALTALFLAVFRDGARRIPVAVGYGVATSALPLLVLFPSLGYGPCGVRSGEAARLVRPMLIGHLAFGAGIGIWAGRLARD